MSDVIQKQIPTSTGRWLGAPLVDTAVGAVPLTAEVQAIRETNLRRVLSQLTLQQQERTSSGRYRLHGQLAPLSQLGHGSAQWNQLVDLVVQTPTAAGYTADFFRDFSYQILIPTRAAAVAGVPNTYQLYYEALPGVALDVMAGTLARDPWGGTLFPFATTGILDVTGRTIEGLPVPLPVTEAVVRLVGPTGSQRYAWPATWVGSEEVPVASSTVGFEAQTVLTNEASIGTWLVSRFKPAAWSGLADGAFKAIILGQLVPLWAAYNLSFTLANVQRNAAFIAHRLGLEGLDYALVTDTGAEVVGPRVRFDPDTDAELVYLSWPRYSVPHELSLVDTPFNRGIVSLLGYEHHLRSGNQLGLSFRFSWDAFHRIKLADFSPFIERAPRLTSAGEPAWAWLNPVTDEYVYRDLLAPGIRQADRGTNYPFLNNAHYVYERVAHYVGPDLTNFNTFRAFSGLLATGRLLEPLTSPATLTAR